MTKGVESMTDMGLLHDPPPGQKDSGILTKRVSRYLINETVVN